MRVQGILASWRWRALVGGKLRPSAHPGGAHKGGHQADPGRAGAGYPQSDRTGHTMPLPAKAGFQPEQGLVTRRGSSGGQTGGGVEDGVPGMPGRDAVHGASGRGQAQMRDRGGAGWEGGSVGAADPQGASSGYLGGMGAGQEEAEEDGMEAAEQGGPELHGAARAVNPKGWLFGRRGGAAASAAVVTRGETPEGRYNEVRGVAGVAYPQGGVSGYRGAAGSALEESSADHDMAAGLDLEEGIARAVGFPGRPSRHRSDRGGGHGQGNADELDLEDDDLSAEEADSAVQGLAAATGSPGRLARHRSDRADALEASQLEPEAEMEDEEDAEFAAGEADPEAQGLAMPEGASGALSDLQYPAWSARWEAAEKTVWMRRTATWQRRMMQKRRTLRPCTPLRLLRVMPRRVLAICGGRAQRRTRRRRQPRAETLTLSQTLAAPTGAAVARSRHWPTSCRAG